MESVTGEVQSHVQMTRDSKPLSRSSLQGYSEDVLWQAALSLGLSPMVLFRWSMDKGLEYVSESVAQFGFSAAELLSGEISWLAQVYPQDLPRIQQQALDSMAQGFYRREYRIVTRDGQVRWVDECTQVQCDASGKAVSNQVVLVDITDRKRRQDQLQQEIARNQALLRVAERLNVQLDLFTVLSTLCEETTRDLDVTAASVTLYRPADDTLVLRAQHGLPADYLQRFVPTPRVVHEEYVQRMGRRIIIPDVQAMPSLPNAEAYAHHNVRTLIVVSLEPHDQLVGTLNIYVMRQPRTFAAGDLALIDGLASFAATAISNAQLYERANVAQRQLQVLSRRLVEVQETERRHIARELHDEVGQALTGLKLLLETSVHLPPDALRARLAEAQALAAELMADVRNLSLNLRPAMLDDLGLLPTLQWYFGRYMSQTQVRVVFKHARLEARFGSEVETAAYRIVQEALTNVARYAGVNEVTVRIWADDRALNMQIEDQGNGFDSEATLLSASSSGLTGMRERATLLGGSLEIETAPGKGVSLTAALPLNGRTACDNGIE